MPYVKPGVYISQKYVASGVTRSDFFIPVVVGVGLKTKRIWSEAIVRGGVLEVVSVNSVTRRFTLSYVSDMKYQTSRLYINGKDMGNMSFVYIDSNTVEIKNEYYVSGAEYKFSYVSVDKNTDKTDFTIKNLLFVAGTPDGSRLYRRGVDFELNVDGEIDWSILERAEVIGNSGTFDLSVNNRLKIGIDGKVPLEIIISGSDMNAVTVNEVVDSINSAFEASSFYGSGYNNVASVNMDGKIVLNSVLVGESGRINFYVPSEKDATNIIFGFVAPNSFLGRGVRPVLGSVYYVRYDTDRSSDEYNVLKLYGGFSEALEDLAPQKVGNDLLLGISLVFENGANVVGAIQVGDDDNDGLYLMTDWFKALDVLKDNTSITDVCVLSTDRDVLSYAVNVIEHEASVIKNHWIGGWFGVDRGVIDGSRDDVGSAIWLANNLFQVPAQSPGRGRFVLVTTPVVGGVRKIVEDTDTGVGIEVDLDTTFLACAVMGRQAGLVPISDTLLRKQIVGFISSSVSDNETSAERLASNGVFCVINKGGRLICFDPVTTDVSGEEIFSEPSIRVQKDYIAYRIRKRLDDLIIGVVPDDLDSFIYELKSHIALELESAIFDKIIAPYTDNAGLVRSIDLFNDIKVVRVPGSKSEFRFMYWFNGRYGVKRLFGEYVVDVPLR